MANNTYRDRDVRNAIVGLLLATGSYDAVYVGAWPQIEGQSAEDCRIVAIEPYGGDLAYPYDGNLLLNAVIDAKAKLTFVCRHDDGVRCDEIAENLVMTAINTLNKSSLTSLVMPYYSGFDSWRWQPARPPERRIVGIFSYRYAADQGVGTAD